MPMVILFDTVYLSLKQCILTLASTFIGCSKRMVKVNIPDRSQDSLSTTKRWAELDALEVLPVSDRYVYCKSHYLT